MDRELAKALFFVIMAAGAVVWVVSLWKTVRLGTVSSHREPFPSAEDMQAGRYESEIGALTLTGDADQLCRAFARSLVQAQGGMFSMLYAIKEYQGERVALKKPGPILCNQPPGLFFTEAEVRFDRAGGSEVQVSYRLGYARLTRLVRRISLGIILGAGLPTMLIVGTVIWLFVIPSADAAVRWQVLQTLQIIHALWPPFLFLQIYSVGRRRSKTLMENLITSLGLTQ